MKTQVKTVEKLIEEVREAEIEAAIHGTSLMIKADTLECVPAPQFPSSEDFVLISLEEAYQTPAVSFDDYDDQHPGQAKIEADDFAESYFCEEAKRRYQDSPEDFDDIAIEYAPEEYYNYLRDSLQEWWGGYTRFEVEIIDWYNNLV